MKLIVEKKKYALMIKNKFGSMRAPGWIKETNLHVQNTVL